jgi:hypothetical protein
MVGYLSSSCSCTQLLPGRHQKIRLERLLDHVVIFLTVVLNIGLHNDHHTAQEDPTLVLSSPDHVVIRFKPAYS